MPRWSAPACGACRCATRCACSSPSWRSLCGRWDRETAIALASFLAIHLLALTLLAVTAYVAGRLVSRRWHSAEGLERLAVSTALGLAVLSHLGFALGLLGLLSRGLLIAGLVGIHLLGLSVWREDFHTCKIRWGRKTVLAGLGLVSAATPLFVLALYPPTAFDETMYHLPYARAFARTGALPFLPELRVPVFPQLAEILYTELLLLVDDVATHLVQLLATLVTGALLVAWGRRSFAPETGWLAAAAYLGNPIVVYLAGTSYVEPVLILFVTASAYALERWRESRTGGWLVLSAAFAASAGATKYLGLFFVAAVFAIALIEIRRERRLAMALAAVVALAVLAPWYGRILVYTGNPLFPFYPKVFGSSAWDPMPSPPRALTERAVDYVRIPLDVLFGRDAVGSQPPYSPVYLAAVPLLALGLVRDSRVRRPFGLAFAYSLLFLFLPPDSRYLAVVLSLVSVALAGSLARWRFRSWLPPALAVLFVLPGWLYSFYGIAREGPLPVEREQRQRYLARELPAYGALDHLNRLRGRSYTVYGIYAENMVYHAEGTLLGDWNGPARYGTVLPALRDAESFHRRLRELGAGYLLLVRDRGVHLPGGPAWRRLFRRIDSDAGAELYELSPFSSGHGT